MDKHKPPIIYFITLILFSTFLINCNRTNPPSKDFSNKDRLVTSENKPNLIDLIKSLNTLPESPSELLGSFNYHETSYKYRHSQVNCIVQKFKHTSIKKKIEDHSIIFLTTCRDHLTLEWEIDSTIEDQILKIRKETEINQFILLDQTIRNDRIIDSYSGPDDLILSIYRKEKPDSEGRASIILTKAY